MDRGCGSSILKKRQAGFLRKLVNQVLYANISRTSPHHGKGSKTICLPYCSPYANIRAKHTRGFNAVLEPPLTIQFLLFIPSLNLLNYSTGNNERWAFHPSRNNAKGHDALTRCAALENYLWHFVIALPEIIRYTHAAPASDSLAAAAVGEKQIRFGTMTKFQAIFSSPSDLHHQPTVVANIYWILMGTLHFIRCPITNSCIHTLTQHRTSTQTSHDMHILNLL